MYKVPFLEPCAGCGCFCEIETKSEYLVLDAAHAHVGDIVTCSQCACVGAIDAGEHGLYCRWDAMLCGICDAAFDEILDGLVAQIRAMVLVG